MKQRFYNSDAKRFLDLVKSRKPPEVKIEPKKPKKIKASKPEVEDFDRMLDYAIANDRS